MNVRHDEPRTAATRSDPTRIPGGAADRPTAIPRRGWRQVLRRAWQESKRDHVSLMAGGVAYGAFLALFPAMIAAVMVYGLLVSPADVTSQIDKFAAGLPGDAQRLLTDQLRTLAEQPSGRLGLGLVVSVALALWGASGGVNGLMNAINVAYDEDDKRGFVRKRAIALGLTLGAILFFGITVALVAVVPAVFDASGLGTVGRVAAEVVRWPLAVAIVMGSLAVLYRIAPDRDAPKLRWVSPGALTATVVWVAASVGFSVYVDNFGKYAKTYGALAGVVVLMLWLYLTAYIVLLGAEINAESEQQTVRDTTRGRPEPLGQRNAVKADSWPGDPGAG